MPRAGSSEHFLAIALPSCKSIAHGIRMDAARSA
jgi:hypothetical protein